MIISTRPEAIHDEEFLQQLLLDVIAEELQAESWPLQLRQSVLGVQCKIRRDGIRSVYPNGSSEIILADEVPVGWLVIDHSPDVIRLVEIMIVGASRGKGIGATLIRSVIAQGVQAGRPIRLNVHNTNLAAMRLYERLGFRSLGRDDVNTLMECLAPGE